MNARWKSTPTAVVAVVAAVSLLLTACSSSDSPSSSGPEGSIVLGTAMPLTGQIVVVPELRAGMEAAVSAINEAGGINGHPLQLDVCDTRFDPNTELSCVRNFISDKVTAIVGGIITADQSGREYQLASQAGIPYVGSYATVPAEFTTPGIFPLNCGFPGWVYGGTKNLVAQGATKIGVISLNNAPGAYGAQLSEEALASLGMKPVTTVLADPQADPTFSTAAAKATSGGVDGIFITLVPALMPKLLTALKNAGYTGKISTLSSLATSAVVQAAGPAAEGMLVTGHTAFAADSSDPGIRAFLADMAKYQPESTIEENSIKGWAAVKLFAEVMSDASGTEGAAAPTSEQVLAAFNDITAPIELGAVGPFGPPAAEPYLSGYDRMFSPWVQNGVVTDGVVQPDGEGYLNPFTQGQ